MTKLSDYYNQQFSNEIGKMPVQRGLDHTLYFGNNVESNHTPWASIKQDMEQVSTSTPELFIAALFSHILVDMVFHDCFYLHGRTQGKVEGQAQYSEWDMKRKNRIKFGQTCLGSTHSRHPLHIIKAAEENHIIDPLRMNALLPEILPLIQEELTKNLSAFAPTSLDTEALLKQYALTDIANFSEAPTPCVLELQKLFAGDQKMEQKIFNVLFPIFTKMWNCRLKFNRDGKPIENAIFAPHWGNNWIPGQGIMFVGKSANGWAETIDSTFKNNSFAKRAIDIGEIEKSSYVRKCAFYRTQKKISCRINEEATDTIWGEWIVYTNLYKIVPQAFGNPTPRMMNNQHDLCIESLKNEIEIFNPKAVVFLTSCLEIPFIKTIMGDEFFETLKTVGHGNTACRYGQWKNHTIICTSHPMRKPENEIVNNVVKILNM